MKEDKTSIKIIVLNLLNIVVMIFIGFHRTFATGVACRQGTLTPPDTWSRPFGTCICSTCWDQSFSELVVILPDYALRISLGTFSILLLKAILQVLIYKTLYDKSYQGSKTTMTSGEWTCLISFATAPLTCSERGGSEKFKMKIYVSSGIRTHTPPVHDRKVAAP